MHKTFKVGLGTAGALVALLGSVAQPARADLAPASTDVVGVGSDTVQYAMDFLADGDHIGDAGFNVGLLNRLVNIDATADANARFAYGPDGLGTGTCAPGTGSTAGTGNTSGPHNDSPCGLNPTVVLRAGLPPVLRPNGSGSGAKALLADSKSTTPGTVNYSRASAPQAQPCTGNPCTGAGTLNSTAAGITFDSITIGTDPLAMLQATTSNAVALTPAQLNSIYSCASTARTWSQVGGTSTDTIVPLLPQIGSGTRSAFLNAIGLSTPGTCVINVEENDPTAIAQNFVALATTVPAGAAVGATSISVATAGDGTTAGKQAVIGQLVSGTGIAAGTTVTAISGTTVTLSTATTAAVPANGAVSFAAQAADVTEPMSGGRLNLFQGKNGTGANNGGATAYKYFMDPSCSLKAAAPAACVSPANALNPAVKFTSLTAASCPAGVTYLCVNRPLYLYFRDADVNSTVSFNSGSTLNWVRTLFYNPCPTGATNCTTIGGNSYGPGGQPYIATAAGQALISAAGIAPTYAVTVGGA